MIKYSIEIYDENIEKLINEIDISERYLSEVISIMGWDEEDKEAFMSGIADFNVTQHQANLLELLLGKRFFSDGLIVQISGGEI